MDPVTISALILAVVSGVASEASGKLWDGLTALVHRPFKGRRGAESPLALESGGVAELMAVEQAPVEESRALLLAQVLVDRANSDLSFRTELESWIAKANHVRFEAGSVTNTVSGGVQHGPVLQGRDFSGLTFNSGTPSQTGE